MPRNSNEEKLVTSLPRIGLIMFPYKKHYTFISEARGNLLTANRIDATSSVKTMSYSKSKSDASGNFVVDLTSDQEWTSVVRPGDWVMLYLSRFGIDKEGTKGLICLGSIDRVARRKNTTKDGKKIFTYRISGRDFGKIFEKSKFYYNPYVPKEVQNNFVILKKGFKITGSPIEFIESYLSLYFGDGFTTRLSANKKPEKISSDKFNQVRLPQQIYTAFGLPKETGNFGDILRTEFGGITDDLFPEGYSWAIPSERAINSSLWEIMMSISNPLMNEFFLSMKYYPLEDKVFPTLTLRKLPYSQDNYTKLPNIRIQENQIITDDIGFSDHERYNWINFDPIAPRMDGYPQFMAAIPDQILDPFALDGSKTSLFPFINKASIARHGLNQFEATTEFAFISAADKKQGKEKNDLDLVRGWQRELIEWWSNYDRYESGTLIVKGYSEINTIDTGTSNSNTANVFLNGKPVLNASVSSTKLGSRATDHLNIGENVHLNSRERLYQLEGVIHEWEAPGISTSTLTVIRGVSWKRKDKTFRFADDVDFKDRKKNEGNVEQKDIGLSIFKRKK